MKRTASLLLAGAFAWAPASAARAGAPAIEPVSSHTAARDPSARWVPLSEQRGLPTDMLWESGSPLTLVSADWSLTDTAYRDRRTRPLKPDQPHTRTSGEVFFKGWLTITAFEAALLTATATAPKEWTGWSPQFVKDGLGNLRDAYSAPPEWDSDSAFINYVGHPYAGAIYYNTVRSQGASKTTSFLFTVLMSTQWEYSFESLAEHPSTQDLFVTPIGGMILGELTHAVTQSLTDDGSGFLEKVLLTVLNPAHTVCVGF